MGTKNVFAAIVGRPNVGKSSILNALLGEKIAIVTDKPQTTRNRITGILTENGVQYVFIDTPGMHVPKTRLGQYMVKQVGESIGDVDVAVLVTEWDKKVSDIERTLCENFKKDGATAILVINKIDTLKDKSLLLSKIAELSTLYEFAAVVAVSALTKDGLDLLMEEITKFSCEGPHFFPDDALTDQPERAVAAEIVREKILKNMRDEIPHGTAVVVESMKEREGAELVDVEVNIFCEKDSHKGMIIGKGGAMLKKIASEARFDLEDFLGVRVNLQCWVKVREGWRDREQQLKNYGFQ